MNKRLIIGLFLMVFCLFIFASCGEEKVEEGFIIQDDWLLKSNWQYSLDGKKVSLLATSEGESDVWNAVSDISETSWSISAEFAFTDLKGDYAYGRMLFGDKNQNVCLSVTLKNSKDNKVAILIDEYIPKGWKNVLTSDFFDVDADQTLKLKVNYTLDSDKVAAVLTQGTTQVAKLNSDRMSSRVYEMFGNFGFGVYGATCSISEITPRIVKTDEGGGSSVESVVIKPGENVESEDWLIGENAVHNIVDGKSVVIINGTQTSSVWNKKEKLGDAWCFQTDIVFGSTLQGSCCARFMFGPNAMGDNNVALVTVEYSGGKQVDCFMETNTSGWARIANQDWVNCSNNSCTVKIYKMAGVNRICLDLIDNGKVLASVASDEIEEDIMKKISHFGLMTYASQVQFGNFSFANSDEGCTLPDITEKIYPIVKKFEIGESVECPDFDLVKGATYYEDSELGKALAIDSKGDVYCYYKESLEGEWSMKARVDFGTYYTNSAAFRIALADDRHDMTGLISIYYSPSNGEDRFNIQSRTNGIWTDEYVRDWAAGDSSFDIEIGTKGDGVLNITVTGANSGSVILQKEVPMSNEALSRTTSIGLGTLGSITRYTNIEIIK